MSVLIPPVGHVSYISILSFQCNAKQGVCGGQMSKTPIAAIPDVLPIIRPPSIVPITSIRPILLGFDDDVQGGQSMHSLHQSKSTLAVLPINPDSSHTRFGDRIVPSIWLQDSIDRMYLVLVGPISTQVEVTGKLSLPMSLLAFADMHLELFLEVTIGRVELDPQSLLAAGDWKILTDLVPKLDININLVQLRLDRVGRILSGLSSIGTGGLDIGVLRARVLGISRDRTVCSSASITVCSSFCSRICGSCCADRSPTLTRESGKCLINQRHVTVEDLEALEGVFLAGDLLFLGADFTMIVLLVLITHAGLLSRCIVSVG
ncbi:hypothetical protein BGZ57DRAFT_173433 [Hyaloscypha finlandica]|nr:hypothetical protein BGZ57DRAFT_173433 [Hyaloscypha finlandica]